MDADGILDNIDLDLYDIDYVLYFIFIHIMREWITWSFSFYFINIIWVGVCPVCMYFCTFRPLFRSYIAIGYSWINLPTPDISFGKIPAPNKNTPNTRKTTPMCNMPILVTTFVSNIPLPAAPAWWCRNLRRVEPWNEWCVSPLSELQIEQFCTIRKYTPRIFLRTNVPLLPNHLIVNYYLCVLNRRSRSRAAHSRRWRCLFMAIAECIPATACILLFKKIKKNKQRIQNFLYFFFC